MKKSVMQLRNEWLLRGQPAPFKAPVQAEQGRDHFVMVAADQETVCEVWSATALEREYLIACINVGAMVLAAGRVV